MRFKARWMDTTSLLLVVVCAACSADREGAPSHPGNAPRTIDLSAMPAAPALEDPPAEAGSASTIKESPEKRACVRDDECAPDFCDRGVCATPGKALYGRDECEPDPPPSPPLPPPPPGMKWGPKAGFPESECGAYLCIDGRCRSCKYNAECGGDLVCKSWPDFPGRSCGKVWPDEPHVRKQPPPMPPILGAGSEPTDPSGRQIPVPSSPQPPPPPPKPSK